MRLFLSFGPGCCIQTLTDMQFFCQEHFLFATYLGPFLPKTRPAVVVDAGANIGLASILFSQVINFNGEVLAIEANPSTLEVLISACLCVTP
jgi:hypothetical protein